MATTKFDIISNAMAGLDAETVSSFDDDSKEAERAAVMYPSIKAVALSIYTWNFNTTISELSREVATPSDVNWTYQYALPENFLRALYCQDQYGVSVPYYIENQKVYCNSDRVFLRHQRDINENDMPPYFVGYLEAAVAMKMSETISGEAGTKATAKENYIMAFKDAKTVDAQSNQPKQFITPRNSRWARARNGGLM